MIPETGKCVPLHLEVGLGVAGCGRDTGMTEIISDDREVDAGLK